MKKKFDPNAGLGIMATVIPVFFGIFFVIFGISAGGAAVSMGAPSVFGLFGGFFALIGVCVIVTSILNGMKMKNHIQSGGSFDDNIGGTYDESFSHKLRSGTTVTIKDLDMDEEPAEPAPKENFAEPEDFSSNDNNNENIFKAGFCTNCGTTAKEDYNFCPKCGKEI